MNITDVGHLTSDADEGEDKMAKGAKREGKTVWEIAEYYTDAFMRDMERLNLVEPHIKCKATDHIQEMIDQVKALEENGYAYVAENGNVYFDTAAFKDYGAMAQLDKQNLEAGARIEVDDNKRSPNDFALWFVTSKHGDQDMQWDSPWGRGFPGWHIECSAMSTRYLGEQFDIHCGGIDHIPVHHTNEIAQAEGATGKSPWVNTWLHGNFLVLEDDAKMAKSGENFLTLQALIDKGYDPLEYRYFILNAHYRKELRFSFDNLDAAKTALRKLKTKVAKLGDKEGTENAKYIEEFSAAVSDDLNMPQALAITWNLIDDDKVSDEDKLATIKKFDTVLGLKLDEEIHFEIPAEVQELLIERNKAREDKDWAKSDELRDKIDELGFEVHDLSGGSEVRPK